MISIIIPTYNEEKNLPKLINAIKQNKDVKYEIIIVDNGSTDKTKEIAKKEKCKFLFNPRKTMVGHSRNMGAEAANGEIIYFIDADWIPLAKNHLKSIEEYFKKNPEKKCGAPTLKHQTNSIVKKILSLENNIPFRSEGVGAYIYKKDFFFKLGAFGDSLGFGEDRNLTKRIQKYSGWIPGAVMIQDVAGNLKSVYKQGKWYGKGFINYFKEMREITPFVSMLFWLAWVPLIPLLFLHTIFNYLLIANLGVMLLISLRYFIKSREFVSFLIPFVKITRSFGELVGLFSFLFSKK